MPKPALIQSNLGSPRSSLPSERRDINRTASEDDHRLWQRTSFPKHNPRHSSEARKPINRKTIRRDSSLPKNSFNDFNVVQPVRTSRQNQAVFGGLKPDQTLKLSASEKKPRGGARSLDGARDGDTSTTENASSWCRLDLSQLDEYGSQSRHRTEVVLSMRQSNVLLSPRVYNSARSEKDAILRDSKSKKDRIQQFTLGPIEAGSICDVFFPPPPPKVKSSQTRKLQPLERKKPITAASENNLPISEGSRSRLPRYMNKKTSPRRKNLVPQHSATKVTTSRKIAARSPELEYSTSEKRSKKISGKENASRSIPGQNLTSCHAGITNFYSATPNHPLGVSRPASTPPEDSSSVPEMLTFQPESRNSGAHPTVQLSCPTSSSKREIYSLDQSDDTLRQADIEHLINQRFLAGLKMSEKSFLNGLREKVSSGYSNVTESESENILERSRVSPSERSKPHCTVDVESSSFSDSLHVSELDSDHAKDLSHTTDKNLTCYRGDHGSILESAVASTETMADNSIKSPMRTPFGLSPSPRKQVHFKDPISIARSTSSIITLEDLGVEDEQELFNRSCQVAGYKMRDDPAVDGRSFPSKSQNRSEGSEVSTAKLLNGASVGNGHSTRNFIQTSQEKSTHDDILANSAGDKRNALPGEGRGHQYTGLPVTIAAPPTQKLSKAVPGPLTTSILLKYPHSAMKPPRKDKKISANVFDSLDRGTGHQMSSGIRTRMEDSQNCHTQEVESAEEIKLSDSPDRGTGHKMSSGYRKRVRTDYDNDYEQQASRTTVSSQEVESAEKLRDLRLRKVMERSPLKERRNIILKSRYFKLWRQNARLLKIVKEKERLRMMRASSFYALTSVAKHFFVWRTFILRQQIAADELYCHHLVKKGFMALHWSADARKFKIDRVRSGRRRLKIGGCFRKWKTRYNRRKIATLKEKFFRWKTRCRNKMIVDIFANRRERFCILQFFYFWREKFHSSVQLRMATEHHGSVLTRKVWHMWRIFAAERIVQNSRAEVSEIKRDGWVLSRNLERWKKATVQMQYATMYRNKKILSKRMKHWKHSTSLSRIQHRKEIMLARISRRKHLTERHFQIWADELKVRGFKKEREKQIVSCCLETWKSQMKRRRAIYKEIMAHYNHTLSRQYFHRIKEHANDRKSRRAQAVQKLEISVLNRHQKSWRDFAMRKVTLRNMQKTFYVQKIKKNMQNLFLNWKTQLLAILGAQERQKQWTLSCVRLAADKWIRLMRLKQMGRLCTKEMMRRRNKKCRDAFHTWKRRLHKERKADERGKEGRILLVREKMRRILRLWNIRSQEAANIKPFVEGMNRRRIARYFDAWLLLRNRRVMKEALSRQINTSVLLTYFRVWKEKLDATKMLEFAAQKNAEFLKRQVFGGWKQFVFRCHLQVIVSDKQQRRLLLRTFYIWATKTTFKQIEESKKLHQHFLAQANAHEILLRWRSTVKQRKADEETSISQFKHRRNLLLKKSKFGHWSSTFRNMQKAKTFASENTRTHLRASLRAWHILAAQSFQERMMQFKSCIDSLRQQEIGPSVFSRFTQSERDITMGSDVITQTNFDDDVATDVQAFNDKLAHVDGSNDCFETTPKCTRVEPTLKSMLCPNMETGSNLSSFSPEDRGSRQPSVAMTNGGADSGILLRDYVSTATPSVQGDERSLDGVKMNGHFSISHATTEENYEGGGSILTHSDHSSAWSVQEEPLTVADLVESAVPLSLRPEEDNKHSSSAVESLPSLKISEKSPISCHPSSLSDENCSLLSSTTKSLQSPTLPPSGDPFLQPVLSDLSHLSTLRVDDSFSWSHVPDGARRSRLSEDESPVSKPKSTCDASTDPHADRGCSMDENTRFPLENEALSNLDEGITQNPIHSPLSTNFPTTDRIPLKDNCTMDVHVPSQQHIFPGTSSEIFGDHVIRGGNDASTLDGMLCTNNGTVSAPADRPVPNLCTHLEYRRFQGAVLGCGDSIERAEVCTPVMLSDKETSAEFGLEAALVEGENETGFDLVPDLSSTVEEADLILEARGSDDGSVMITTSSSDDAMASSEMTSSGSDDTIDDVTESATLEILKRKPRPVLPVHVGFRDTAIPTTEWLLRLAVVRLRYRPLAFTFHQWKLLIFAKRWTRDMLSHMKKRHRELSKEQHFRFWMRKTFQSLKAKGHRRRVQEKRYLWFWVQWTVTRRHRRRMKNLAESTYRSNLTQTAYDTWSQKHQRKKALLGILSYWQTQTKRHISPRSKHREDRQLSAECLHIWRAKADQAMRAVKYRNTVVMLRYFSAWSTWASEKASTSQRCDEMKTRIVKRKVLNAWRRHALLMRIVKAKENASIRNGISSLMSRWHGHTQVKKFQRSVISLISASCRSKTTRVCFDHWEQELTKRKIAAVMHRRCLMKKFIHAWRDVTKDIVDDKNKFTSVQEMVGKHSIRAVMLKWLEVMLMQSRVNSLKTKHLVNLVMRCWETWKEKLALKRADQAYSRFLSKRILCNWTKAREQRKSSKERAKATLRKWHEVTLRNQSLLRMADQFRSRSRALSAEISFNLWLIARDQATKAKLHHQRKVAKRIFGTWNALSRRKKWLKKTRINFIAQKRKELFAISWYKWKHCHQVRMRNSNVIVAHQKAATLRILRRHWVIWNRRMREKNADRTCTDMILNQAFSKWKDAHEKNKKADRFCKSNKNSRLITILKSWQRYASQIRQERKIISELRESRNRILVISTFMMWLKSCSNSGFASAFRDNGLKRKVLCRLKRRNDDKKRLQSCYNQAVELVKTTILKVYFSHWKLAFRRARMLEVSCDKFLEMKRNKNLKKKWMKWFKAKEKRDLQRLRQRDLSLQAIKVWRSYAAKRINKRLIKEEEIVAVQRFKNNWICKRAFRIWWNEYQVKYVLRKSQLNLLTREWRSWTTKTAMIICARQMHHIWIVQKSWRKWRLEFVRTRSAEQVTRSVNLDLMKKVLQALRVYTYEKRTGRRYCAIIQSPKQEENLTPRKKSRIPVLKK